MAFKIRNSYHSSTVDTDKTTIGSSFDLAKVHQHTLSEGPILSSGAFFGLIEGLFVQLKNIDSATKIIATVALDAAGDYKFFPDTEAEIALGITDSTNGTAVFNFGLPLKNFLNSSSLYVFIRTDAGTVTLDATHLTYRS
jgi:hypothetical protein